MADGRRRHRPLRDVSLLQPDSGNPVELFQIWLNLPARDKLAPPHFTMLWARDIPTLTQVDEAGGQTEIRLIAGHLGDTQAPSPPPRSWAAQADSDLAIFCLRLSPRARCVPASSDGQSDAAHAVFFRGSRLQVGDESLTSHIGVSVRADASLLLTAGDDETEVLPAGPPDRRAGGQLRSLRHEHPRRAAAGVCRLSAHALWRLALGSRRPVHARDEGRFARHADGRIERLPR